MIRPASEIEYPPSEALCTKARMIVRLEALGESSKGLMAVVAKRLLAESKENPLHVEELNVHEKEQKRLIENMRRIVKETA